jgi:hypothetical protein
MDQIRQTGAVSCLLQAWGRGDLQARDDLMPVVYGELRRRAGARGETVPTRSAPTRRSSSFSR